MSVSENHYHAANQTDSSAQNSEQWPPPWYSSFWPSWAFVVVGLGAAVAAIWTLFAIKEQASHLSSQVRLLEQQLAAFIESQRPKITADPHENPAQDFFDPKGPHLYIAVTNVGLTTAYDCTYETWIEVITPPFTDFSPAADHFVCDEPKSLHPKSKPLVVNIPLRRGLRPGEEHMIKTHAQDVCIRVLVKYRDAFSPNRHANFGYMLDADGFRFLPKYQDSN